MISGLWIALGAAVMAILALMLSACIKSTSAMGGNARKDAGGRVTLLDTPQMRADAADSYDRTIEMEKRGHVLSDGMTWNDRWINTIRAIRGNTENPEWYVQYIIQKRREAGLPELTGLDDPEP